MEIGLQQNGCVYLKVVVHELLHSLGFMHEMNRPDRDDYVSMVWSNIQANGASQFFKDAWVGTDESTLPAECPYSGQPDGKKVDVRRRRKYFKSNIQELTIPPATLAGRLMPVAWLMTITPSCTTGSHRKHERYFLYFF